MALKKVYVSISREEYKENRLLLLNSQADILKIMKRLETIKKIRIEKKNLGGILLRQYSSFLENLKNLKSYLPDAQIPKEHEAKITSKKKIHKEEIAVDTFELDNELKNIQEKLKMLNG